MGELSSTSMDQRLVIGEMQITAAWIPTKKHERGIVGLYDQNRRAVIAAARLLVHFGSYDNVRRLKCQDHKEESRNVYAVQDS
jgi:hypothetical protein